VGETCIDIQNDMRVIIVVIDRSGEGDPVRII